MDIENDQIKPYVAALRVRDEVPPRAAVGALLSLIPKPDAVLTTRSATGDDTWQLFAYDHTGLAVVIASASAKWSWSRFNDPQDRTLQATLHPHKAITAVDLSDVSIWHGDVDDGSVRGRATWAITVSGEKLVLDPNAVGTSAPIDPATFCRGLLDARA